MKYLLATCIFFIAGNLYAYSEFGVCNYGKQTLPEIICYGPTVLKETTITGDVKIAGSVQAYNITVGGKMEVTGNLLLHVAKLSGNLEVVGNVDAEQVEFNKSINATAENVNLNQSKLKGEIHIKSPSKKPILKMTCSSLASGSVTFEGKEGLVQLTNDSRVQGKIINGTIEFIKAECPVLKDSM